MPESEDGTMSEASPAASRRLPLPLRGMLVVGLLVVIAIIVVLTLIVSAVQTGIARTNFTKAESKVTHLVLADDDAHAALTSTEGSTFVSSATSAVTGLASCLGASATTSAKSELGQVADLSSDPGAPHDILPLISTPTTDAQYLAETRLLLARIAVFKQHTADTRADTQAILLAQNEVDQDLDSIATSISGSSTKLVRKDIYATSVVKDAYSKSVADVGTEAASIAPDLASRRVLKLSSLQSTALISALAQFATECKAEAASSRAHVPAPAVHHGGSSGYPDWHTAHWPIESFPDEFNIAVHTEGLPTLGCVGTKLLAEGTATGPRGGFETVHVPGSDPPLFNVLVHHVSATAEQWAVVQCSKA
jgi:Tfp pilus assembly protein PilE